MVGLRSVSQCLYESLRIGCSYTTNSVIAPSRKWTCMSAAAGSSQPSSLERAIFLVCVMSIGMVTITDGQQSLLFGGTSAQCTFASPGSFTSTVESEDGCCRSVQNILSHHCDYASQVAGANAMSQKHQSSLVLCAADNCQLFQDTA